MISFLEIQIRSQIKMVFLLEASFSYTKIKPLRVLRGFFTYDSDTGISFLKKPMKSSDSLVFMILHRLDYYAMHSI